ncbi:MAG: ABC transporter permease [Deltaproteobacteria bacterium]|nr:ABC transporter permease [Deltaproteobacteria bacterium]
MLNKFFSKNYDSPWQIAWRRFKKHKLASYSLILLALLSLIVILVPWILEIGFHYDSNVTRIDERFLPLSWQHPLGTDDLGRDVLLRIFYGGRISLAIALISAFFSLFIGLAIGAWAGYYGGLIDTLLMRFTDAMLSLPQLPLMILLAAIDLQKVVPDTLSFIARGNTASMIKLMIIVVFFGWMTVARLVRGEFLSLKEWEFVQAAKGIGVPNRKIIWRHMIPNCIAPIIVATTLSMGSIILYEAVLSFLGLGVQPPIPSWGNMLNNAQEYIRLAPLLAFFPGFFILITVVSINFIGDGLRDAFDPQFVNRR